MSPCHYKFLEGFKVKGGMNKMPLSDIYLGEDDQIWHLSIWQTSKLLSNKSGCHIHALQNSLNCWWGERKRLIQYILFVCWSTIKSYWSTHLIDGIFHQCAKWICGDLHRHHCIYQSFKGSNSLVYWKPITNEPVMMYYYFHSHALKTVMMLDENESCILDG